MFVWFVSSKFRWLWLVAGNRYFQCVDVSEVGVLDHDGGDGGLIVAGGRGLGLIIGLRTTQPLRAAFYTYF